MVNHVQIISPTQRTITISYDNFDFVSSRLQVKSKQSKARTHRHTVNYEQHLIYQRLPASDSDPQWNWSACLGTEHQFIFLLLSYPTRHVELLQYSDGRGSYINPCLALTISYQIGFRELDQLTISNTLIVSIQFQTMEPRTPIASSSVHPRHGFYSHQLALPSK